MGHQKFNPRVGLIYGDSITLARARDILKLLADKGFASSNVVFGIGSYTYQYLTRDSFGWALQAGVDVALSGNWYANLDVKKIFLSTDVSINGGAVTADVDLDPWVVGFGVGYKF